MATSYLNTLHWLDWAVLIGTLAFIVLYGVYKTRGDSNSASYLKGDESTKWFAVGLSVMATQASAITFMSTPGQAFHDGMGFVQLYFGLPLAMVFISIFFLPIFKNLKVYTAYEYLEQRFDNKTRLFTATLFLIQRGLGAGITIFAPAIILSTILGWQLNLLCVIIGTMVIIYTVSGGAKAVGITHKQQMAVMMGGMVLAFILIITKLPEGIGLMEAYSIASIGDKTKILNFSFDLDNRYTIWSGIAGGFFLALSYFGTDQSQVQRYLTSQDEQQSRLGLIMNGILKIPLQFFILLVGVMVFVFFQFKQAPVFFNSQALTQLEQTEAKPMLDKYTTEYSVLFDERRNLLLDNPQLHQEEIQRFNLQERTVRDSVKGLIKTYVPSMEANDKDYVFISYILNFLPIGVIGLLLAMIFSAAMSSTASELSALATTTTIDVFKRNISPNLTDEAYVQYTKGFTVLWGFIAIGFACICSLFENLIQFVNIVGSIFYGTILGVFLVGFFFKKVMGNSVFWAAVATEMMVIFIYFNYDIGYLWLNLIGAFLVILLSNVAQMIVGNTTVSTR